MSLKPPVVLLKNTVSHKLLNFRKCFADNTNVDMEEARVAI